jgi:hypothetical protein
MWYCVIGLVLMVLAVQLFLHLRLHIVYLASSLFLLFHTPGFAATFVDSIVIHKLHHPFKFIPRVGS